MVRGKEGDAKENLRAHFASPSQDMANVVFQGCNAVAAALKMETEYFSKVLLSSDKFTRRFNPQGQQ
jgi:hypothetical protein